VGASERSENEANTQDRRTSLLLKILEMVGALSLGLGEG
jgi:hypothetical protein